MVQPRSVFILLVTHTEKKRSKSIVHLFVKACCLNSHIGLNPIMINAFDGLLALDVLYGYDFDACAPWNNRLRQVVFDEGS